MTTHKILLLPGDGIGPEVMTEARKILEWLGNSTDLRFEIHDDLIGGVSYEAHGTPITDSVLVKAKDAHATLLGAVGGPQWVDVPYDKRPEAGLLTLRKELDLFANLRPAVVFDALIDASSLKPDIIRGLDIMIVRELTGGVYFGEPRGIENIGGDVRRGFNTQEYTSPEIRRVGAVAFELARKRNNRVTSCEKSNVMESGILWREEITYIHDRHYRDVTLDHMYADNCAMQLLRDPKQFDVIVTDNLFGDILSDEASMLTGSLGMLPSACLGEEESGGHRLAVYEPVHGSAPDIAGQNKANPCAMILSLSMALRYSLGLNNYADALDQAVKAVLGKGIRTPDIMAEGCTLVGTIEMGDMILQDLGERLKNADAA